MNHLQPILISQLKREGYALITDEPSIAAINESFNLPFEYLSFHFWVRYHPAHSTLITDAFCQSPDETIFAYRIIAEQQSLAYASEYEYLTWQSAGATFGTDNYIRRYEISNDAVVTPKSVRITRHLKKLGFTLIKNNILPTRTTIKQEEAATESFGITGQDIYQRAGLRLTISYTTADNQTLGLAIRNTGLRASLSTVWIIPGGKGQKKLATRVGNAIKERILGEVGRVTSLNGIYVLCATRGGKGGYKQKVNRVWFPFHEKQS